jgi:hypothetical protein
MTTRFTSVGFARRELNGPLSGAGRIGEILLAIGAIESSQLKQALREQAQNGRRLGEILIACQALDRGTLRAALLLQTRARELG